LKDREERVIIALGEGKFEARSVTAGIESGDYVEIMEGVNEGEKIVTSGQFLIDSEASMRASITRMSEPQESESGMSDMSDATESKIVSGSGVVKVVMAEDRKLKLQHEPIKELGWPAMTMDFILADDVDISNLSVDEKVMFVLEERDDRYLITAIHEMKAGGSDNGGM